MEYENNKSAIQSLPYDMILMILKYTSIHDMLSFGSTCKQFDELLNSPQAMWKNSLRKSVNQRVFKEIEKNVNGNWYNEIKIYYNLQSEIHASLIDMAAYYYKSNNDITLDDVRQLFKNSFSNGLSYYYSIIILQELLKTGNKNLAMYIAKRPYTLTEMFYAKVALEHLIHSYLVIKWVQVTECGVPPVTILNLFMQWVDPLKIYIDEKVIDAVNSVQKLVDVECETIHPPKSELSTRELCVSGAITMEDVVAAVSRIMYKVKHFIPVFQEKTATLDVVRAINIGRAHDLVIAALFYSVVIKYGIQCKMTIKSKDVFVDFQMIGTKQEVTNTDSNSEKFISKLLESFPTVPSKCNPIYDEYCPEWLLEFAIEECLYRMDTHNWCKHNAMKLRAFLRMEPNSTSKYETYWQYLMDNAQSPALSTPINVTCLTDEHLMIITSLSYLTKSPAPDKIELVPKKRISNLKYAVGMIVQHKECNYISVIREWQVGAKDEVAARSKEKVLEFGPGQPFYVVIAIDQSDRYVAQEHLVEVAQPTRLLNLEDILAKEFTHFNGFAYEPNIHKRVEYPDDMAVSEQYRTRMGSRYGSPSPVPDLSYESD